ncbi:Hypothetical_protein [Hexamita inflata]|uniref:Hypothetical_protein n=1 Tax=Hexamita inflata TaxID=28002 RepID=A0AA86QCP3_9EUKA|nr:Hypothetical protein HINF_LOCUS43198 [Hexamita inflata]
MIQIVWNFSLDLVEQQQAPKFEFYLQLSLRPCNFYKLCSIGYVSFCVCREKRWFIPIFMQSQPIDDKNQQKTLQRDRDDDKLLRHICVYANSLIILHNLALKGVAFSLIRGLPFSTPLQVKCIQNVSKNNVVFEGFMAKKQGQNA